MIIPIILLVLLVQTNLSVVSASAHYEKENELRSHNNSYRMSKLLMYVSVPPIPCGTDYDGVCLPKRACARNGGQISAGSCHNGYGECCSFTAMCDATTSDVELTKHVTTITSPTPITRSCSFRIKKQTNVCQVMIRFVNYVSTGADVNGICSTDSFSIRGSITVDEGFTTCGVLTGQHMYLGFGNGDTIQIRPSFTQAGGGAYKIVVTQIQCNSAMRVPDYCLQHFTETTGKVTSLDYPNQQQSQQYYTICIDGPANPSRISWKRCEPMTAQPARDTFFISGGGPGGAINCDLDSDWVQINGRNRRCEFPPLPATIQSSVSPFTLNVNFNENERIEFPIPEELRNLDENTCGTVGVGIRPDLLGVVSCLWQAPAIPTDRGICVCTLSTNFVAFFGESDFGNTGFCLEYSQT